MPALSQGEWLYEETSNRSDSHTSQSPFHPYIQDFRARETCSTSTAFCSKSLPPGSKGNFYLYLQEGAKHFDNDTTIWTSNTTNIMWTPRSMPCYNLQFRAYLTIYPTIWPYGAFKNNSTTDVIALLSTFCCNPSADGYFQRHAILQGRFPSALSEAQNTTPCSFEVL
jgi:hypothetical protein